MVQCQTNQWFAGSGHKNLGIGDKKVKSKKVKDFFLTFALNWGLSQASLL
jgi:hypothetical protein